MLNKAGNMHEYHQGWSSSKEFESIYNQHLTGLLAYALKFVDEQVARDMVQDIFINLWNRPPQLTGSLRSYLYTSVRNASLDYLKSQKVKERYINQRLIQLQIEEAEYYQVHESILEQDRLDMIREEINRLPVKCRSIFELSYYEDMKSSEIALKLNLSVRTVQNQLYRGLTILRNNIIQKGNRLVMFLHIFVKNIIFFKTKQ